MWRVRRAECVLMASAMFAAVCSGPLLTQSVQYPKPTELPNPYRLVVSWPMLPKSMNGGHWGEVIRVDVARDGYIWVFNGCFNTMPLGHATCKERAAANPPILKFNPAGKLFGSRRRFVRLSIGTADIHCPGKAAGGELANQSAPARADTAHDHCKKGDCRSAHSGKL